MVGFSLSIEAAPAYELLMTLAVFSDTEGRQTYELEPRWFENVRTAASPELLEQIDSLSGSDMLWAHLLGLAYEAPPPRDVRCFLAYLEQTDPLEIRLHLLGYYVRYLRRLTSPEVIAAAAAGDQTAQAELLRTSEPANGGWQRALRAVLPLDPGATKGLVLEILRGWNDQVFREQEVTVMPILLRDAEHKQVAARLSPPERVIEAALPAYEYVPEPRIRRVLLIPSFVIRPEISTMELGETKIFVYPVADESIEAASDAPSPRLLRLARALGDERRLRILRRLTSGDFTLHELATHFEVSDTTMLHHLIILRSAGLVRLREAGGKRYRLERHTLPEMGRLLEAYLGRSVGDL